MDTGNDFLKSQVSNAVMQHGAFLKSLEDHESQADDQRYRDLCARYIAPMREHQHMLEDYAHALGAHESNVKKAAGATLGFARDLADAARDDDFLRLVGDIVVSRQSEDTFRTFRDAGRELNLQRLADIGETGERGHDAYDRDANRLVQQMFVEHVRGTGPSVRAASRDALHR